MQISIVVPVHNSGLFLEETIRSVIEQTHSHWELLLVDDGSTDNSADICRSFENEDSRIKLLTKDNGGQASARNHGVLNATYDWIAFLDSDDWWYKKKLESVFQIIKKGSYYSRKSIDYKKMKYFNLKKINMKNFNRIKAFIFPPFQSPYLNNKKVSDIKFINNNFKITYD